MLNKDRSAQERDVVIQREPGPTGQRVRDRSPPDHNFMFVSSEMNFDGKLVKGAPYSAQAITERTQVLSDGNRIVNKSAASVYRDSEGRTRREQTLKVIGPFATAGDPPQDHFHQRSGGRCELCARAENAYSSQDGTDAV